jgi:hypothetical protein
MSRKKDTDGIKGVSASDATKGVKATHSVSEVEKVKGASAVKGVSGVSSVKQSSGVGSIRFEQREKLFSMIAEEAQKLAAQGIIPKNQREVVEKAVQMVIDAALLDHQDNDGHKNKK